MPGLRCLLLAAALAACAEAGGAPPGEGAAAGAPDTSVPATAGRVVDSILPIEEQIRRFRVQVPETPERLSGGEQSRDALVRRWVRAVEGRDSVALSAMLLTAAEYITLFYPESQYARPPYRQDPGVRWGLMLNTSHTGAARVWARHAGLPMGFTGYQCNPEPEIAGRNKIWTGCVVEWRNGPAQGAIRLFGPIIERDGEFKFLTYGSGY